VHYRHLLEELGKKPGMLGEIFRRARQEIQNPAMLTGLFLSAMLSLARNGDNGSLSAIGGGTDIPDRPPQWRTVSQIPATFVGTLRHTFASQLAMAGVSLYKISKWLGHSDVKTSQIYARLQTQDEDINRF
jgi:hypothetical protein